MELKTDLWHLAFAYLMTQKAPPNFEVLSEFRLTIEPQRADMILLRRKDVVRQDEQAGVFRRLWAWLGNVTVLEYKSPVNYAFKPGDLLRLWVYGGLYELSHWDELPDRRELTLVLVVASITPTLRAELVRLNATLVLLEGGYARIDGLGYTCLVAIIDEVCESERDEYLHVFSHQQKLTTNTAMWMRQWLREAKMKGTNVEEMQDADVWFQGIIEKMPIKNRLSGLRSDEVMREYPPEERLAGLETDEVMSHYSPEQRLAGLDAEQLAVNLPIDLLRALGDDYINTLPPDVQQKIRQRLRDETH